LKSLDERLLDDFFIADTEDGYGFGIHPALDSFLKSVYKA
jgi:hypothetical protein